MKLSKLFFSFIVFSIVMTAKVLLAASDVPMHIKYRYEKQTGRQWSEASPERQKQFINQIEREQAKRKKGIAAYNTKVSNEKLKVEEEFSEKKKEKEKILKKKRELLKKKKEAAAKRKKTLEKKKKASAELLKKVRKK